MCDIKFRVKKILKKKKKKSEKNHQFRKNVSEKNKWR